MTPIASDDLWRHVSRRALPKVPFGNLIEQGLLKPGDRLFDAKKRFQAKVRADGSLLTEKDKQGQFTRLVPNFKGCHLVMVGVFGTLNAMAKPVFD